MPISEYNRDQLNTLIQIRHFLKNRPSSLKNQLKEKVRPFLEFRAVVDNFQMQYLENICTSKCFQDMQSACCNKEGIATFFADFVINIINTDDPGLDQIEEHLLREVSGYKCVYLTNHGCLWNYKPIVCEMFLCDHAKTALKEKGSAYISRWNKLREEEKKYTWPDKPVLFDDLESMFLAEGIESPLMYFHKSPGLLRIKSRWKSN